MHSQGQSLPLGMGSEFLLRKTVSTHEYLWPPVQAIYIHIHFPHSPSLTIPPSLSLLPSHTLLPTLSLPHSPPLTLPPTFSLPHSPSLWPQGPREIPPSLSLTHSPSHTLPPSLSFPVAIRTNKRYLYMYRHTLHTILQIVRPPIHSLPSLLEVK